ncbi:uncharacterized protein LOC120021165 [Salvelinus namaycush]|uniref:Uncharacterized protein LOC120021165 n=1 Tax=Salvelinus namaycush TaxID=8040 RepID=A0A8U0PAB3_SALNM|nr:uncharacterized protein LOC120021165 [Salvelinus namaycush]
MYYSSPVPEITKVTRVIKGEPTVTKVTRVIEGEPIITKVTRVVEGEPTFTKVTRVIEGEPIITKVTRVVEGEPTFTKVTRVIETEPKITKVVVEGEPTFTTVTRVIEGEPSITKVTRVIETHSGSSDGGLETDGEMKRILDEGPDFAKITTIHGNTGMIDQESERITKLIQGGGSKGAPAKRSPAGVRRRKARLVRRHNNQNSRPALTRPNQLRPVQTSSSQ